MFLKNDLQICQIRERVLKPNKSTLFLVTTTASVETKTLAVQQTKISSSSATLQAVASLKMVKPGAEFRGVTLYNV